jgi:signal peptidase I
MSAWTAVVAIPLAACLLSVLLGLLLARRWFVVVTVTGASMEPALRPGDRVLVRRCGARPLQVGAIVMFREPDYIWVPATTRRPATVPEPDGAPQPTASVRRIAGRGLAGQRWVVKRIAATPGGAVPDSVRPAVGGADTVPPQMLVVLGDAPRSGDSRQWGFIPADQALGLVVRRLSPPDGAPTATRPAH